MIITMEDRYLGCLIGLAVGDAVGTTVEFKSPGTFPPVTDMTGGGPFKLTPGAWTDDTSMALCLAESLLTCGAFNAQDQMERYLRWWKEGYLSSTGEFFDIGNTVVSALHKFSQDGDPIAGSTDARSAGNGRGFFITRYQTKHQDPSQNNAQIFSGHLFCQFSRRYTKVTSWPKVFFSLTSEELFHRQKQRVSH
jgi:hypothetical protein